MSNPDDDRPATAPVEALRWAVQSQRALAFNLGYLDMPTPEDENLPDLTWQMLSELHHAEYERLSDFIYRRMAQGETLTPEWLTEEDTRRRLEEGDES